jgi:hypothetical protein
MGFSRFRLEGVFLLNQLSHALDKAHLKAFRVQDGGSFGNVIGDDANKALWGFGLEHAFGGGVADDWNFLVKFQSHGILLG